MHNFRLSINIICFAVGLFFSFCFFVPFANADTVIFHNVAYDYATSEVVNISNLSSGCYDYRQIDEPIVSVHDTYLSVNIPFNDRTGYPYCDNSKGFYDSFKSVNYYFATVDTINGIQDANEDGIDCGGSTGVDCVQRCPYGFVLHDGLCYKSAGLGPNPAGGDYIPYVNPTISASPILAPADMTILDDQWTISNTIIPTDNFSTTLINNSSSSFDSSDYVIKDTSGNIIASQLTGELSSTDNGDGTKTEVQTQTTYNPITNVDRTSIKTNIYNSTTNELISSSVQSSGSSSIHDISSSIDSGLGSNNALSGDQYAHGNSDILQSLDDIKTALSVDDSDDLDDEVSIPSYAVEGVDFDGSLSPDDIPDKLSIPDTITDFINNSPLFILLHSLHVEIENPQCKFTVDNLSFFGETMSLDFDLCRWQEFLQSLGAFMLMFTQALAVIVIFRGVK